MSPNRPSRLAIGWSLATTARINARIILKTFCGSQLARDSQRTWTQSVFPYPSTITPIPNRKGCKMMKFVAVLATALASMDAAEAKKLFGSSFPKVTAEMAQKVPALREKELEQKKKFYEKIGKVAKPVGKARKLDQMNYNNGNGDWQWEEYEGDWNWNDEAGMEEFGFDITEYSIKYTGCHNVVGYNDNVAQNDAFDTVLGQSRFATFRLCQSNSCYPNNKYGCYENYGDYVVSLDQLVAALIEYSENRAENFCTYCEACAAISGYRQWALQMEQQLEYEAEIAEEYFEQWAQNYAQQQRNQQMYYMNNNQNANGGQAYYAYNGNQAQDQQDYDFDLDDEELRIEMMTQYYTTVQNTVQNGQFQYGNYNQNNQNQYVGQDVWNYNTFNGGNQNNGNQNNQNNWNGAGNFPSFYNKAILSGFFNNQGQFVPGFGFFDANGEYFFLSEEDAEEAADNYGYEGDRVLPWDEDMFGEQPAGWANYEGVDVDELADMQCDATYSSNCYNNYQACQTVLYGDDSSLQWFQNAMMECEDYECMEQVKYALTQYQNRQVDVNQLLSCQQMDYNAGNDVQQQMYEEQQQYQQQQQEQNNYNQQGNYAQLYQMNKYFQNQMQQCGNDDNCIAEIEYEMELNQEYQQWLQNMAWEYYQEYREDEVEVEYYVGAACDAETNEISLAVYNDEECLVAEQSGVTVSDLLGGYNPMDDIEGSLIPDGCIQCGQEFYTPLYEGEEDEQEEEGISPICSMLYQLSGKCNQNLQPENVVDGGYYYNGEYVQSDFNMYMSEEQQQNEERVCGYIESLNSGTYTETGEVYVDNSFGQVGNGIANNIAAATSEMPGAMKAAIVLAALASFGMAMYACLLHGALARRNIPWRPKGATDPTDLARQNSGIVMGRSRSGAASAPLI